MIYKPYKVNAPTPQFGVAIIFADTAEFRSFEY